MMQPRSSDVWAEHYSARNVMQLAASGASCVAGYREWKEAGRQVRRGEHGIRLTAPVVVVDKKTNERKMVNTRTVVVFDISQTEPIDNEREDFRRETLATQNLVASMEMEGLL